MLKTSTTLGGCFSAAEYLDLLHILCLTLKLPPRGLENGGRGYLWISGFHLSSQVLAPALASVQALQTVQLDGVSSGFWTTSSTG